MRRRGAARFRALLLLLSVCVPAVASESADPWSPGLHEGTLRHAGLERRYLYHVPERLARGEVPLVLLLHINRFPPEQMRAMVAGGFEALSEEHGFVLAYPAAHQNYWNDGRGVREMETHRLGVDDTGYLAAVIARLSPPGRLRRGRVFLAGFMQGGMLAQRFACERPGEAAAIGVVSGPIAREVARACPERVAVPVLMIHGRADPFVRWDDDTVRVGRRSFGKRLPLPAAVDFWLGRGGCPRAPAKRRLPDADPADGTRVLHWRYAPCAAGGAVELYEIEGGGNTWPGGKAPSPEFIAGRVSRDIDASRVLWEFFSAAGR